MRFVLKSISFHLWLCISVCSVCYITFTASLSRLPCIRSYLALFTQSVVDLQCNFCDLRHFVTQVKMMSFSVCFTCLVFFLSLCRNCYQYCCHCSRITNPVYAVDFGAAVFSRVIIQNFNWLQVFVPLKSFCCFPTFVSMAASNYSFSKLIQPFTTTTI